MRWRIPCGERGSRKRRRRARSNLLGGGAGPLEHDGPDGRSPLACLRASSFVRRRRQLERKVFREPFQVTFDGLDKRAGFNVVELSQVRAKHDLLAADYEDAAFDQLHWYRQPVYMRLFCHMERFVYSKP